VGFNLNFAAYQFVVLKVANLHALIIGLKRLCHLQPEHWNITQAHYDTFTVIQVCNILYFFVEFYRWVMDFVT